MGILPNPDKFDQWWTEHEPLRFVYPKCHVYGFKPVFVGPAQVLYSLLWYGKYWKKPYGLCVMPMHHTGPLQ